MKRYPELNCPENYCDLCAECHLYQCVNGWEFKVWFWGEQVKKYGEVHMRQWLDGLPLKVKPRF